MLDKNIEIILSKIDKYYERLVKRENMAGCRDAITNLAFEIAELRYAEKHPVIEDTPIKVEEEKKPEVKIQEVKKSIENINTDALLKWANKTTK